MQGPTLANFLLKNAIKPKVLPINPIAKINGALIYSTK